jgi:hypothetical protein
MTLYLHSRLALLPKPEVMMPAVYVKSRDHFKKGKAWRIRYFLVISIPAETPFFSFIDHVI